MRKKNCGLIKAKLTFSLCVSSSQPESRQAFRLLLWCGVNFTWYSPNLNLHMQWWIVCGFKVLLSLCSTFLIKLELVFLNALHVSPLVRVGFYRWPSHDVIFLQIHWTFRGNDWLWENRPTSCIFALLTLFETVLLFSSKSFFFFHSICVWRPHPHHLYLLAVLLCVTRELLARGMFNFQRHRCSRPSLFAGNQTAYVHKMSEANGRQRAAHCLCIFSPFEFGIILFTNGFQKVSTWELELISFKRMICSLYVKRSNIITFYGVLCTHLHVITVGECASSRCQLYCCQSFKRASCTLHTCIGGIFTAVYVIFNLFFFAVFFFCVKTLWIYLHLHSLQ